MFFRLENTKINYEGQGLCYVSLPENMKENAVAVIAVHGSGRSARDYVETEFYKRQCDIANSYGCLFAVVSNVRDTWGTDSGVYNVNLLIDYITQNYPVQKKVVLWCTSAGGVTANRLVKEYPDKIKAVIGTFPVYDLVSGFNLDSCKKAWNCFDINEFKAIIDGKNPPQFVQKLKSIPYFIAHGDADSAVLFSENSQRLASESGDNVYLQKVRGGEHSTDNFEYYGDAVKLAFSTF